MPIAKVQMSDGRIAKFEVPEGTSPEDVVSFAQKMESEQKTTNLNTEPKKQTLTQNIDRRIGQLSDIYKAQGANEQTLAETAFQTPAPIIGAASDVVGAGLGAGWQGVKEIAPKNMKTGMNLVEAAGKSIAGSTPVQYAAKKWQELEQASPRAARNIGAAGTYATLGLPIKPVVGQNIKRAGNVLDRVSEAGFEKLGNLTGTKKINSEDLKKQANVVFQKAEQIGGDIDSSMVDEWIDRVFKDVDARTPEERILFKDAFDKVEDQVINMVDLQGKPLSLKAADGIHSKLGRLKMENVTPTGELNEVGRAYATMQKNLTDIINEADESGKILGGNEGLKAYREGRDIWRRKSKVSELQEILNQADLKGDRASGFIESELQKIAKDPKRRAGWKPEELEMLRDAAKTGSFSDVLNFSNLTGSFSMARGDIGRGSLLKAAGEASRSAKTAAKYSQVDRLAQFVANGGDVKSPTFAKSYISSVGKIPLSAIKLTGKSLETVGSAIKKIEQAKVSQLSLMNLTDVLTNEEISAIMSLPPEQAKVILGEE